MYKNKISVCKEDLFSLTTTPEKQSVKPKEDTDEQLKHNKYYTALKPKDLYR